MTRHSNAKVTTIQRGYLFRENDQCFLSIQTAHGIVRGELPKVLKLESELGVPGREPLKESSSALVSGLIKLFLALELICPLSFVFRRVLVVVLPLLVRSDRGFSEIPSKSACGVELREDCRECVESDRISERRRLILDTSFSESSWLCLCEWCLWCFSGCLGGTCGLSLQRPVHHFQPPSTFARARLFCFTFARSKLRRSFSFSQ